jgi:hypothetical protein
MANFRCERAFVMLDEPVPGLNHLRAVDPEGFADLLNDAISFWMVEAGYTPLTDFCMRRMTVPNGNRLARDCGRYGEPWSCTGSGSKPARTHSDVRRRAWNETLRCWTRSPKC